VCGQILRISLYKRKGRCAVQTFSPKHFDPNPHNHNEQDLMGILAFFVKLSLEGRRFHLMGNRHAVLSFDPSPTPENIWTPGNLKKPLTKHSVKNQSLQAVPQIRRNGLLNPSV